MSETPDPGRARGVSLGDVSVAADVAKPDSDLIAEAAELPAGRSHMRDWPLIGALATVTALAREVAALRSRVADLEQRQAASDAAADREWQLKRDG